MSGGSEKKMLTLRSVDGKLFDIEAEVAVMLETIHNLIEDGVVGEVPVPLTNVNGDILAKVTKYLRKHVEVEAKIRKRAVGPGRNNTSSDGDVGDACRELRKELKEWDAEFIADVSQDVLFGIVLTANYLDIKPLLDLSCQKVADLIKDKSSEEVRELFGIENDYTPEEEAAAR